MILLSALYFAVTSAPFSVWIFAQGAPQEDLFAKYPVQARFSGRPVPSQLSDLDARAYRTRLRAAVTEGNKFARHYEVAV